MHRIIFLWVAVAAGLCPGAAQAETSLERVQERAERLLSPDRGGPSEILYVGPGGAPCDYADFDDALAAAAPNAEIRVTAGPFGGPFVTGEKSLTVIGGYSSCSASEATARTTLTGNGSSTVMTILSSDGSASLDLRNLVLENGSNGSFAGGLDIRGGVNVLLRNVAIRDNTSGANGGGMRVAHSTNTDGALVLMLDGTEIDSNTAQSAGGGLACEGQGGAQHAIVLDNGIILSNQAQRGGGVYARNCTFVSHAGGSSQGIVGNDASDDGAGIYAVEGSQVTINGTAPGFLTPGNPGVPAELLNNIAAGSGGGVYASGSGTRFLSIDGEIRGNRAFGGAAVYIVDGAELDVGRGPETTCGFLFFQGDNQQCSRIWYNVGNAETIVVAGDGTSGRIAQTFISHNETTNAVTTGLIEAYGPAGGASTALTLEGVVAFENDTNFTLVEAWGDLEFQVNWSTVANNEIRNPLRLFYSLAVDGVDPRIEVNSSIVWQPGIDMAGSNGSESFFFDCNIAHALDFPGQISRSLVADPLFVNPSVARTNYHVQPESPAVDFCDDSVSSPLDPDMDGEARGVPVTPGSSTPFDAGADEALDRIFADRFSP